MKTRNKVLLIALATLGLSACGGGGGSSSTSPASATQSVNQAPLVRFNSECTNERVCTLTSTSTDPDGSIVSSLWRFPDGSTANGTEVSHTFAEYGSYSVSLTVTDNDGASRTLSNTVDVLVDLHTNQVNIEHYHPSVIFMQDFNHREDQPYSADKLISDVCDSYGIEPYNGEWCGWNEYRVADWNIVDGALKVDLTADGENNYFGFNKGFNLDFSEVFLTYTIVYDEHFASGDADMKLLGLQGTLDRNKHVSGGVGPQGPDGGFSSRWVLKHGGIKQYVYHNKQEGQYGDSIYAPNNNNDLFKFKAGVKYTIEMRVKMNTPGEFDGEIETFINGESLLLTENYSFSESGAYGVNSLVFWFAGLNTNSKNEQATFYLDNIVMSSERVVEAN